jgi:hypothetical protein
VGICGTNHCGTRQEMAFTAVEPDMCIFHMLCFIFCDVKCIYRVLPDCCGSKNPLPEQRSYLLQIKCAE